MATLSLEILIDEFNKLPGIGRKTAQRLAFAVMEMSREEVENFAEALINVKNKVKQCTVCGNLSEEETCAICRDEERKHSIICVVEETKDVLAMEKSGVFNGVYHVLHGKISPLDRVGPEELNIRTLLGRIAKGEVEEVILALNPDLEGETTGIYLSKMLTPLGVKVTKIASGIPMGGNLEFADMATIARSLEGRQKVD